ncbi:hypothetical protein CPY51_29885 [Rhizobium tubonense]|uniref:Uncharacterized protein n=1 Tax=Rhizobium tubonense TaxID=484088 RepID=A0A2W4DV97_9HYPH|nr:hypothetical protein CPY51_29885 [Rhizobium tubonense]
MPNVAAFAVLLHDASIIILTIFSHFVELWHGALRLRSTINAAYSSGSMGLNHLLMFELWRDANSFMLSFLIPK